jgi:formate transporter
MVCLVWMSYSGRSLMDKALIMVLPVAMFVASGFEHSIANMFMIPGYRHPFLQPGVLDRSWFIPGKFLLT